jgi:uncharacterized MAPEG superfamily protein
MKEMLAIWSLTTVALFLKMVVIAMVQGSVRIRNNAFAKPEDAAAFGKGAKVLEKDLPMAEYGQRALRNDLENIPMFVAISYAYVALGAWELGAKIYFPLFVLARIGHTFCYLPPKQPGRTISYGIGLLTTLVVCGHVVFEAISSLM